MRARKVLLMTTTTATAQHIAIAHTNASGRTGATYGLTVDAFAVGEVVEVHAQGKTRPAVVDKLGRNRLTVSWTTPTEIANAAKRGRDVLAVSKAVDAKFVGKIEAVTDEQAEAARLVREQRDAEREAWLAEYNARKNAPAAEAAPVVEAPVEPVVEAEVVVEAEAIVEGAAVTINREEWLTRAVDALRPLFRERAGVELPATVAVSVGWPGGKSVEKVIGQCWNTKAGDGVAHLFISPRLADPVMVLATLAHELVHAWDDCESGHKAAFARVAKAIGLTGKMTATVPGDELVDTLKIVADSIGEYPHKKITTGGGPKKQTTRMLKVECPGCGYVVRTTAKWVEVGLPTCVCGESMELVEAGE